MAGNEALFVYTPDADIVDFTVTFSMFSFIQAYVTGGILMILIGAFIFSIPFVCLYFFQRMFGWRKALWLFPFVWPLFVWFFLEQTISLPVLSVSTSQASLADSVH
jgi:hypothetical protein